MRRMMAVALLALLASGCVLGRRKTIILTETERYYFIPAGTPFHAVVIKGQPPIEVIRGKDSWCVDSGYLLKLQKEANREVLKIPNE